MSSTQHRGRRLLGGLLLSASVLVVGAACDDKQDRVVSSSVVANADEAAASARHAAGTDNMEKVTHEMNEAGREIGAANEAVAAHAKDLDEAVAKRDGEVAEGRREVTRAFADVRDDVRALSAKTADFTAARDRVVAEITAHVERRHLDAGALVAKMTTATRPPLRKQLNDLDVSYRVALRAVAGLRDATADKWDGLRSTAMDDVVAFDTSVDDATAKAAVE